MGDIVLLLILAGIFLMNVYATILVRRDVYGEPRQRVFQAIFIWLVPIIGALLVIGIHRQPEKHSGSYRAGGRLGDHFGTQHPLVRSIGDALDGD